MPRLGKFEDPSAAPSNKNQLNLDAFCRSLTEYNSLDTIKAAIIQHWAFCNDIPLRCVRQGSGIKELFERASPPSSSLTSQIQKNYSSLSLKNVESLFERLLGDQTRKSLGVVYTPSYLIDYLVRTALHLSWHDKQTLPTIYDPSCGGAGFLIRAAEILASAYGISPLITFSHCLFGSDKDPQALVNALYLVELYIASCGHSLAGCRVNLREMDPLLMSPAEVCHTLGVENGFSIVTTNPPYVKLQSLALDYRAALSHKYPYLTKGSFSLAPLFLLAGREMLASGGCLAYITQNNLFTSLAGSEVRRDLQHKKNLRRIIDFGHNQVFEGASAYTCLIFLGKEPVETFEYERLEEKVDAASLVTARFATMRHDQLKPDKWRLAKDDHAANVKRLETIGRPLGEVAAIKVGFATLKDKFFFTRDCGDHCVSLGPTGDRFYIERELTRPAVKISQMASESDLDQNDKRVIFPYIRSGGKYVLLDEDTLESCYPAAYCYLCACRAMLEKRDAGRKEYAAWFAWGRTQGMEATGPKLLTKTFSKTPLFLLDKSDQLFCNGYAVFPQFTASLFDTVSIEALKRLLNSRVMHYYAKMTSFQIGGNYQCYQKNFIERFSIVAMTEQERELLIGLSSDHVDSYIAELYGLDLNIINREIGFA